MLAPMQYRNFVWPNNPRVFEVEYRRTLHSYKLPFSGYVVQNLGLQNKIIRGEGEFVGPKAYENFRRLAALFEENKGGKLVHPVWPTMRAYFAKLSLKQEPKEDYISYSFEFWEYIAARSRMLRRRSTTPTTATRQRRSAACAITALSKTTLCA